MVLEQTLKDSNVFLMWHDMNATILGKKCTASEIPKDLPLPGRHPSQLRQFDLQPDNADAKSLKQMMVHAFCLWERMNISSYVLL
jgi:hypothetical protein